MCILKKKKELNRVSNFDEVMHGYGPDIGGGLNERCKLNNIIHNNIRSKSVFTCPAITLN